MISNKLFKHWLLILVNDGTTCQETVCELRLANYSRNDPSLIECIADNGKSTRVSKVFHVDVHCKSKRKSLWKCFNDRSFDADAPQLVINIRKFTGTRTIDILLQCSSISNPPATISWLDEHRHPIEDSSTYKIKVTNQSSTLSFIVVRARLNFRRTTTNDSITSLHKIFFLSFITVTVVIQSEVTRS